MDAPAFSSAMPTARWAKQSGDDVEEQGALLERWSQEVTCARATGKAGSSGVVSSMADKAMVLARAGDAWGRVAMARRAARRPAHGLPPTFA